MTASDGASSISVTVRVRPFTIREAAQLAKTDDGPFFLGDGSLACAPTPQLKQKGLKPVIKVVDDKCLYGVTSCHMGTGRGLMGTAECLTLQTTTRCSA